MSDFENIIIMLAKASIDFKVDSLYGWHKRIVLSNNTCFCFDTDGKLATYRSTDDCEEF